MKKLTLILLFNLFTAPFAQAWVLETLFRRLEGGEISQINQFVCTGDESRFCQDLCQHPLQCNVIANSCISCAGSSSHVVRALMTRADQLYTALSAPVTDAELIMYLQSQSYIVLNSRSLYNYFRPWNSDELVRNFLFICPSDSQDGQFLVRLDHRGFPSYFDYVLCRQKDESTKVFKVQNRDKKWVPSSNLARLIRTHEESIIDDTNGLSNNQPSFEER
ncbi:MAG: hypothetical protein ACK5Y2_14345 [Bdellovibrionales bacterium]